MTSKRKKEAPSTPSTEFFANNLPSESAEGVVAPGVTQVRLLGHEQDVERIAAILERDGFLKTGMAPEKPPSQDPHLWRAYLVKKTQATIEDANIEAELAKVTVAQDDLVKLKGRIAGGTTSLEKAQKGLTTMPDDAEHFAVRALQRNLVDKIREEIHHDQLQLQHLERVVHEGAGLLEKQRRQSRTREVIAMLPKLPCQNETCQKVGGLRPAQGIEQPQFASYSRDQGWRDPNIAVGIESDEDAKVETEIAQAEAQLPDAEARLLIAQQELAKMEPERLRIERDLLKGETKDRSYGTLNFEKTQFKTLLDSVKTDIKTQQARVEELKKTIAKHDGLNEKTRKKVLVQKCLETPPVCDVCGKPTVLVKHRPQPTFAFCTWTTKPTDYHAWYIEFWCEGPDMKCRKTERIYPDEPASTTPKMRIVQTADGPRLTGAKDQ